MIRGLLSTNQLSLPFKCQVLVSARLGSPNFPVPASAFMGIQPVAGEIRSPEPNLLSLFSHFLTLVGLEYPLKAPKSFFHTALSFSITLLGLPGSLSTHLLPVPQLALRLTPGPCTAWFIHQLHCSEGFFFSWTGQRRTVLAS